MRAGARESPGRPLGWRPQPLGPRVAPGLVPPPPQAVPGPACGSPPGPFQGRKDKDEREWGDRKEEELGGRRRDGGAKSADQ